MFALTNARIFTVTKGIIEKGTVLIEFGKISAVGKDIAIPGDIPVYDLNGACVTPGFIDAHCHVGIFNEGTGDIGEDGNDCTDPVTPFLRASDGIYPDDEGFDDARSHGVTTLCVGPGSGNVVGGQMAVVKPRSNILEKMLVTEYIGLKCAFGENPKRVYGERKAMPSTRMGVAALLRKMLREAKQYKQKKEYALRKNDGDEKEPFAEEEAREIVLKVIEGKVPLRAHAHRMDDIQTAIRIASEFEVPIVIEHCTEGYKIAGYLAEKGIPVILGPINGTKPKVELKDATLNAPRILEEAGVTFAIMTDAPVERIGALFDDVRLAIRHGLSPEYGLKSITINAAKILGLDDTIGSIEPGKSADLNVFSGDPFDFRSTIQAVLIDGEVRYGGLE